jgi:hypothetical protein
MKLLVCAAIVMLAAGMMQAAHATPASPYARTPSAGASVRFDASAAGETHAWAYPNLNYLEAFLRSTIEAATASSSYEEYQKKMALVLDKSVSLPNGTPASVQHVQTFVYHGHQDVEVQVKVAAGTLNHSVVWTTPAELVDSSGRKYLR